MNHPTLNSIACTNAITISSYEGPGNEVHYTGRNVLGNASTINNGAVSTDNTNTYLNHVEGSSVMNSLKIQGTNGIETSSASSTLTIKGTAATASNLGSVKLGSDTKQTVPANGVTSAAGKTYAIQTNNAGQLVVNVPRTDNNTYTAGDGLSLASNVFKANLKSYTKSPNAAIDGGTDANRQYAVSLDKNGKLSVNVPRTDAGGSSFWKTDSSNRLTPKNGEDLYFKDGTKIKFGGKLYFQDTGIHLSYISAGTSCQGTVGVTQMDEKGLRVGTNTCNEVYGISTLGKISAGMVGSCSANTITMYATGGSNSSNDHYEILGSNRLLVGTKGNSYIYFGNNGKVGINRTNLDSSYATVQIKGSLQISNCGTNTCNMNNVGQMRYFETGNIGYFVGCRKAGTSYERVVLSDSNTTQTPTTVNCTMSVPYNTAEYDLVAPSVCR